MKSFLAAVALLLLPSIVTACDVCGIFLGIQPYDRTSSFSILYRMRWMEGDLVGVGMKSLAPKHGGHGIQGIPMTGQDHYRELYQVWDLRGDFWLGQRFAVLASLPVVNNYRSVNGFVSADVYGMGDPLLIGRYLVANTRCLSGEDRTVHRLMLGGGVKAPVGRNDLTYNDGEVPVDLQPGTGTWDLLGTAEYMVRRGRNGAAVSMIGRYNGTNAGGYRLGHGLSTTAEVFRRWDGTALRFMPFLGLYHELSGKDAGNGMTVQGTGASTLFAHAGSRVWWRSWMLSATVQIAAAQAVGDLMVPNRMRIVTGITYNLVHN